MAPAIDAAERGRAIRRLPENLDAWAAYQQAMWYRAKADAAVNERACRLFERAIQLDPMFAAAYAGLARAYGYAGVHHRILPFDEALRKNLTYARNAVELDPGDADTLAGLSIALIWEGDLENALPIARQALAAILAADMAGYSRLMGADKESTIACLKGLRRKAFFCVELSQQCSCPSK